MLEQAEAAYKVEALKKDRKTRAQSTADPDGRVLSQLGLTQMGMLANAD